MLEMLDQLLFNRPTRTAPPSTACLHLVRTGPLQ